MTSRMLAVFASICLSRHSRHSGPAILRERVLDPLQLWGLAPLTWLVPHPRSLCEGMIFFTPTAPSTGPTRRTACGGIRGPRPNAKVSPITPQY